VVGGDGPAPARERDRRLSTAPRHDAITDVAGIRVGHWTDAAAATGCTVVLCEGGAVGGVDVRGGAPGTRETDLLRPGMLVDAVHGVLLTGGSAFGLDAAGGVMRWCEERGIGLGFGGARVPIVVGANLFDLNLGRSDVRPDAASGYAAAAAATDGPVAAGCVGAGTGATVAKALGLDRAFKGGIGSASENLGGFVVAAIAVVNAAGEIVDSGDGSVIAAPRAADGSFIDTLAVLREGAAAEAMGPESTTLAVVATDASLSKEQANRLATLAHDGFARAIRPVHTLSDGDVVFALATGAAGPPDPSGLRAIEAFASRAVERAIVRAVLAATPLAGLPAVRP